MRYYVEERSLRAAGISEPTIRLIRALSGIDFQEEATSDIPVTHKLPIKLGNVTYYLLLSDT